MCLGMYINYRVPNQDQRLGPEKKLVANKPNTQTWAEPTIFLAGSTGFENMRDIVGLSKAQRISRASLLFYIPDIGPSSMQDTQNSSKPEEFGPVPALLLIVWQLGNSS